MERRHELPVLAVSPVCRAPPPPQSRTGLATAGQFRLNGNRRWDIVPFVWEDAQMDYRVYIVGRDERFIGVREIDAPDDKAALRKARRYVGDRDVEIWQRDRRIGRIASNERSKSQNSVVQLALRRLSQKEH